MSLTAKWWEGDMLAFDTESTGKNPKTAKIVTACVAWLRGDGTVKESWEILINPGEEIAAGATRVHGITNEMAADGQDPLTALPRIVSTLAGHMRMGTPVVAMNARFDFTILDRNCVHHGLLTLDDHLGGCVQPVLDPYVLDKAVDQYRKGSRKLVDMCAHYGVELLNAHNATADAIAAGHLAQAIVRRNKGLQIPLEKLHHAQEVWARQQAVSLEQYLRRKENDENIYCEREWPLVPIKETA